MPECRCPKLYLWTYDRASDLNRPSVFRLNIGIIKATYRSLFGSPPPRHGEDGIADTSYDFTALDHLLPHPVYGRMHWVCVLNPSDATRFWLHFVSSLSLLGHERLLYKRRQILPDESESL